MFNGRYRGELDLTRVAGLRGMGEPASTCMREWPTNAYERLLVLGAMSGKREDRLAASRREQQSICEACTRWEVGRSYRRMFLGWGCCLLTHGVVRFWIGVGGK